MAQTSYIAQKKRAEEEYQRESSVNQFANDIMLQRYERHAAKRQFQRLVKEKVQKKIEAYEEGIEQRRKKWGDIIMF